VCAARLGLEFRMAKRACYIHIGPHKTGTKSIQWFLREHRSELLKYGYFVPESGNIHGGHHVIARDLCGQELPEHQRSTVSNFARALDETPSKAVVISSEDLYGLLRRRDYAEALFHRIEKLNLIPELVLFPRNQSQLSNSRYAQVVKGFRCSKAFKAFVQELTRGPTVRYSQLIELADTFDVRLVACPFTGETIGRGVVPEFLRAIGIDPSQFPDASVRRNPAAGPFTVSVGRCVLRSITTAGRHLKWLQAERCKRKLAAYLEQNGWADTGYCGLTTTLARHIEQQLRSDNDAFAQRVWGRSWAEIFAADTAEEFTPNDLEMCRPDWFTARRLRRATREMKKIVEEVMLDPVLAVEAAWNDLAQRAGLVSE
jgi:hypothetical protein